VKSRNRFAPASIESDGVRSPRKPSPQFFLPFPAIRKGSFKEVMQYNGTPGGSPRVARRRLVALLGLISLLPAAFVAGCGSGSGTITPPAASLAQVRVVHASPDAPNVDVLADGSRVLTNVPYTASSGYLPVPAGTRNVRVNPTGSSTSVINTDLNLIGQTSYTVLATGRVANIAPLALLDDRSAPTAGNAKVRLVHAAPGAANVDIYVTAPSASLVGETPVLSNVPFRAASDYLELPAGSYQIRITPTGTQTVAIDTGAVTLNAGAIRTGIALGDPGVGQALTAILLNDN
jgi:hypothetical protein